MDSLPQDIIIHISKTIAIYGVQNLFEFLNYLQLSSKNFQQKDSIASLTTRLFEVCYWLLALYRKLVFTHKLSCSGHTEYSVVLGSQMLQGGRPDLTEISFIFRKAAKHGSDEARYFMMMLDGVNPQVHGLPM